MAYLARDWVLGKIDCQGCAHGWNAAIDSDTLFLQGAILVEVMLGKRALDFRCPVCGRLSGRITELLGE